MTTDVEGALCRIQTGDDFETRLVDCTFRFLGILQSDTDLITPFRVLVGLKIAYRLSKVVLNEVEEGVVVLLLHPRVAYDECTVCDDRSGRLIERGSTRTGYDDAILTLSHSTRAPGPPARNTSMSIIGSVAVESDIPSGGFEKASESGRRVADSLPRL